MIGRTLGHYVIAERLGAGGMGEVYRARDTRLERDVALKVLTGDAMAAPDARRQLRKEALALSRLNHPNIATVHDFDEAEGLAFVVMELVAGQDLRERLAAGPLAEGEVIRLGIQAAEGLQAAHAAGVIHRDLKPANLRITPDGRLKILDFGIAARVPTGADPTRFVTETMRVAGTLPYMAPEQLRGHPPDPRADLHALCTVLYELATGTRPFDATNEAELIDQILNDLPPPPRPRNPGVSAGLEAILLKGLERRPNGAIRPPRRSPSISNGFAPRPPLHVTGGPHRPLAGRRGGPGPPSRQPSYCSRLSAGGRSGAPPFPDRRWRSHRATGFSSPTSRTRRASPCSTRRFPPLSASASPSPPTPTCSRARGWTNHCGGWDGRTSLASTKRWAARSASVRACVASSSPRSGASVRNTRSRHG
jgi:serine/threonine protein kinase